MIRLNKVLSNKNIKNVFIAVLIIIFASAYTYFYGINNFNGFKQVLPTNGLTAYTHTIMHHNIFLGLLTPIISIIASYNLIFKVDVDGIKKAIENLFRSCICGGSAFIIALTSVFIFYNLIFPSDINNMVPPAMGPMVEIFEYSRPLYFIMSLVNSFLVGAAYASLSCSIAMSSKKKLFSIVLPYMLYRSANFTSNLFYILPSDTFSAEAMPRDLLSYYLSIFIVYIIAALIVIIKFRKRERG